jgi:YVTN family beta-propeller protein
MKHTFRLCHAFVILLTFFVSIGVLPAARAATLVVANKAEATASLINLESGEVVATLPTGEGPHEVGISPDGRFAMVSNYGRRGSPGQSLTLIDIPSASVVKTIDLGEYRSPHGVEWLDDARVAVTVEANQALIVVDVDKAAVSSAIETGQQTSHMVALDPARQRAYTANIGSGSLTVLDVATGERLKNIETGKGAEGLTVAGADGQIWVTNREDDTVTVIDGDTLEVLKTMPSEGFPIRAAATAKGQVLVTRARAGDLVIYDAESFEQLRVVPFDIESMGSEGRLFGDRFGDSSVPIGVVVDGNGEHAFVAHANADVITEVDLANGAIVRMLHAGREPDGMGYSDVVVNTP